MRTLLVLVGTVCALASAQDVNFGDAEDSSSPSEEFDTPEDTPEKTEGADTRFFQGNNGGFNNGGFNDGQNGGFNNGGFNNGQNGGFNNGGFNNGQNGGLTLGGLLNGQNGGLNNGGFNNGQNGGFNNGGFNNGGFNNGQNGGFNNGQNGAFNNGQNGGFNNGQNGGFNNGGFNNGQNGGFNNGGFNNGQNNGGFNNGGFNNGQCGCQCRPDLTFQYNGRVQGNCRTPDETGRLWCYTTGPVGTCGDLQQSQRFPNNPWSYNACRAQLTCGGGIGSSLGVRSSVKTRDCKGRPIGDEYFGCGCETRRKRQLTFSKDESEGDAEKDADRCAEADLAGKTAANPDF